jgi:hypothetical protein
MNLRHTPPRDLELAGSREELIALSKVIEVTAKSGAQRSIPIPLADPFPFHRALSHLVIVPAEGPVMISIQGDDVHITGAARNMERFASQLAFEAGARQTLRNFEWFPGNDFVAKDSIPMVISVTRAAPRA